MRFIKFANTYLNFSFIDRINCTEWEDRKVIWSEDGHNVYDEEGCKVYQSLGTYTYRIDVLQRRQAKLIEIEFESFKTKEERDTRLLELISEINGNKECQCTQQKS